MAIFGIYIRFLWCSFLLGWSTLRGKPDMIDRLLHLPLDFAWIMVWRSPGSPVGIAVFCTGCRNKKSRACKEGNQDKPSTVEKREIYHGLTLYTMNMRFLLLLNKPCRTSDCFFHVFDLLELECVN